MQHLGGCHFHTWTHICLFAEWSPQGDPANAFSHVQPGGDTHQHTGLSYVYVVGTLADDTELEVGGSERCHSRRQGEKEGEGEMDKRLKAIVLQKIDMGE